MARPGAPSAGGDTLRAYLRDIAEFPRLSVEEERELGRRIQAEHDEEARRRLVECNLRFVVSYAKRYCGLGVPFLDLIHEGNLGLIEAAKRFDPSRNVKFITYGVWWMRLGMLRALSDQARAFSVPARLSGIAARLGSEVATLAAKLDRAPTSREIADDLDISEADVDALLQISGDDLSLSDHVGQAGDEGEGRELGELLPQEAVPPVEHDLMREAFLVELRAALSALEPKEAEIVRLRYGLDGGEAKTLQQIGDRLGLTRERIRQVESRARGKLRRSKKLREARRQLN